MVILMPTPFSNNLRGWLMWQACTTIVVVLEKLTPRRAVCHRPCDVEALTNDEILDLCKSSEHCLDASAVDVHNVVRITENVVVKLAQEADMKNPNPTEALALQLVSEQTNIPVPRVFRAFQVYDDTYTVMEYVDGEQLGVVWPRLSFFGRLRVAFTLCSYVRQLRRIRLPERQDVPGPLALPGRGALAFFSPLWNPLQDKRGPFPSYASFTNFLNDRMSFTMELLEDRGQRTDHLKETMDDSKPLVFTHSDLSLKNIIIGRDGHVWLLDFGMAGFFPPWVEFVTMGRLSRFERMPHWLEMIPLICGWYYEQYAWFNIMAESLYSR